MRRPRCAAAWLALSGLVLPGPLALTVTVWRTADHLRESRHEGAHVHRTDLRAVWHGHAHAATTPDHDHAFFVGTSQARLSGPKRSTLLPAAVPPWTAPAAGVAGAERRGEPHPPRLAGVGPPPAGRRPILRI